jgi:hypothetical protein
MKSTQQKFIVKRSMKPPKTVFKMNVEEEKKILPIKKRENIIKTKKDPIDQNNFKKNWPPLDLKQQSQEYESRRLVIYNDNELFTN